MSVTCMTCGLPVAPGAVTVTVPVCVPEPNLDGSTLMVTVAGVRAVAGVAVIH